MQDDVLKYIEMELKKGYDSYKLKKDLMAIGHPEDEINEAFREIATKKKLRTLLIVLPIVVIVIIISVYIYRGIASNTQEQIEVKFSEYETNVTKLAISTGNPDLCRETGNLNMYCLGVVNKDIALCKKIKRDLAESCILDIAKKEKNPAICEQTGSLEGTCYLQLAIVMQDKTLCSKATGYVDYCKSIVK